MPSRLRTPRPPSLPSAIAVAARRRRPSPKRGAAARAGAGRASSRCRRPAGRAFDGSARSRCRRSRTPVVPSCHGRSRLHANPPLCKKPRLDGSPGPEKHSLVTPLKWQSIVPRLRSYDRFELGHLDAAGEATRLARVEPARRRPRASRPRPPRRQRAAPRRSACRRARAARKAARSTSPEPTVETGSTCGRDGPVALDLTLLAEQREAARLLRDQHVARAELGDRRRAPGGSPRPRGTPGRRALSASRWFGETRNGSACDAQPQRLALRVEHGRDAAPVQVADQASA